MVQPRPTAAEPREIQRAEHWSGDDVTAKQAVNYVWDVDNLRWLKMAANDEGEIKVNLEVSDIEIGAVEIKNADTDDRAAVNTDGELSVKQSGFLDTNNSTVQTLNAGIAFTGDATDITDYSIIFITVYSNKASATDGLSIQQSPDGTNWDNTDEYTVPADKGKTYSIQAGAKWLRIVYTNGGENQGVFRMQTMLKKNNALASSHRLQDNITNDDDAELVKAVIAVQTNDELTYKNVDVQNPMPIDGDSVYAKDLDLVHTVTTGWTSINGGTVSDLFGKHDEGITFTGSDNPKSLTIQFRRPVITTGGMGIVTETGSFSNVKVIAVQQDGTETVLKDFSGDSTDRTILPIQFAPTGFAAIRLEFHTADVISLTTVYIPKAITTIARIQALKPDGTVTDIDATTGGNLKISMEEMAGTVDSGNSSIDVLDIDEVFTGDSMDVKDFASINVNVYASHISATDGLEAQFSPDGTNWDIVDYFTIPAVTGKTYTFQPAARYMRIVYTNGGTLQTAFRLQTVLRPVIIKGSTHRVNDTITTEDDAELVKAILTGKTVGGNFINFGSTSGGNFKMSLEELENGISSNTNTQLNVTQFRADGTEGTKTISETDMEGGGKVSVGTTAVEATFTGATQSIIISADIENTGTLYIGKSNVTDAGANAMAFILAGESVTIDYDDATNAVYVVATAASQNFWKGALIS